MATNTTMQDFTVLSKLGISSTINDKFIIF